MPHGLTLEEILAELENHQESDDEDDDMELAIIPPDADVITDEEDIGGNVLNNESGAESGMLSTKKYECKWYKCQPTYTNTSEPGKSNEHYVAECLANKTVPHVFEDFFSEKLMDTIIEQSEIYACQHNKINFLITKEELKSFIVILLLSGYHKLPHENMYWKQAPDVGVSLVFNSMSRNRLWEMKRFIHLNDNSKLDRNDKMYKLRLYFEMLKKEFGKCGVFHSELSIDEMMVRYYGKHSAKIFLRGKPIKFGYKIWCLTSSNGFLHNFSPYCGMARLTTNRSL
ncbi:piggyBac transposable element-derived protein 3-like [Schistocerca serialis cubense]|uniref:piggyBac transposable element-derived protein 3-like n=1 Tax=Schistocerca serialis cubense TaxID=2023355 RepID=UPI00214F27B7|nr:piggyBac transposable element-derived protein 3-like [Schistocerca serialis cubense]